MGSRKKRSLKPETNTAVVYARVSALDSQSESDISLEQQERTLTAMAEAAGYSVVVVRERHTASKTQPQLEVALDGLDAGTYAALYAAKIDRLSRKGAVDVLQMADRAEDFGWRLVVADVALDTGTPAGRLVLTVLAAIAEFESRRRSERMVEYHAGRRARGEIPGIHYGRRRITRPDTTERILAARRLGRTYSEIARELNSERVEGRHWHPQTVRRLALAVPAELANN